MPPVPDTALVVPVGASWNELSRIYPLLQGCKVVYASDDAPGFFINDARTEIILKLPPPKITGTATCNGDGSITFDFQIS